MAIDEVGGFRVESGAGADAAREGVSGKSGQPMAVAGVELNRAGTGIEQDIGTEQLRAGGVEADGDGALAVEDRKFVAGTAVDVADGVGKDGGATGGFMGQAAGAEAGGEIAEEGLIIEPIAGAFGGGMGVAFEVAFEVVAVKILGGFPRGNADGEGGEFF